MDDYIETRFDIKNERLILCFGYDTEQISLSYQDGLDLYKQLSQIQKSLRHLIKGKAERYNYQFIKKDK